ncbi:hypothetical protein [Limnofasciculus baicalensis]|uniref:DUF4351 domain-containing protein n=1 Tax=Limnofasciculus baicalensis BBK-W-15 TaxID=2699891 RepID=A0AAE3GWC4_9CYAN|nr:hypothetical protein [Limnofasciculus baicalensis]MCP2730983.1 hypothetical protein [Limnofasciculus baicalensis BBK-W-15]
MPYITSVERIGIRKGLEQGLEQGQITKGQEDIIRILEVRLKNIPPQLRTLIGFIKDQEVLGTLLVQVVTLQSVEAFLEVASQYVTPDELELARKEQSSDESTDEPSC